MFVCACYFYRYLVPTGHLKKRHRVLISPEWAIVLRPSGAIIVILIYHIVSDCNVVYLKFENSINNILVFLWSLSAS